jgi:hypothetical protein
MKKAPFASLFLFGPEFLGDGQKYLSPSGDPCIIADDAPVLLFRILADRIPSR